MASDAVKQTPKVADDASYVEGLSFSGNPNLSSTIEVSGGPTQTSSSVSGLFEIITQTAQILYKRVPNLSMQHQVVSLSAEPSINSTIPYTRLRAKVELAVTRRFVNGVYDSSSFTQGQRFRVHAVDTDQYGNTYGDLSANGGSFCLGPAGSIITDIPYYSRRLIDPTNATSMLTLSTGTSSLDGWNCGFKRGHFVTDSNGSGVNADQHAWDAGNCTDPAAPCGFEGAFDGLTEFIQGPVYSIPGGYQTQLEDDASLINFVDTACQKVSTARWYESQPALLHPNDPERSILNTLPPSQALWSYKVNRHDWT